MKKLIFFPLVLLALALSACGTLRGSGHVETETREIGRFDSINLAGIGEVIITQGEETTLVVEAEDNLLRYLQTEVRGDTLTLSLRQPGPMVSVWPTQPIKYYVTVTDLEAITITGSGDVTAESLDADQMELTVIGSGDLHLDALQSDDVGMTVAGSGNITVDDLSARELMANVTGSGTCSLQGEAVEQAVRITGSGDYRADDLQSETARVTIAGSGSGYISVTDSLDVRITGSGDVRYSGSPQLSQTIIGSGDVVDLGGR